MDQTTNNQEVIQPLTLLRYITVSSLTVGALVLTLVLDRFRLSVCISICISILLSVCIFVQPVSWCLYEIYFYNSCFHQQLFNFNVNRFEKLHVTD